MGPTEQLASSRARSSSVGENAFTSGDDTESTPMVAPSDTSGSTTIEPIAKPCPAMATKRGSLLHVDDAHRLAVRQHPPGDARAHPELHRRRIVRDAGTGAREEVGPRRVEQADGRMVARQDGDRRVGHRAERVFERTSVGELLGELEQDEQVLESVIRHRVACGIMASIVRPVRGESMSPWRIATRVLFQSRCPPGPGTQAGCRPRWRWPGPRRLDDAAVRAFCSPA